MSPAQEEASDTSGVGADHPRWPEKLSAGSRATELPASNQISNKKRGRDVADGIMYIN